MAILEHTDTVDGVSLPFRTYEDQPRRALRRGTAYLLHWSRRARQAPSVHVVRLALQAARFVASPSQVDAELLADYSMFVRLTASLLQVRREQSFADVVTHAITTGSPADLAHDECVLFLAAKMRAVGLDVKTPTLGASNPDLHIPRATARGDDIYFEVKEREPRAPRDPGALDDFIRRRITACKKQIKKRGGRGFACIDLGVVGEASIPRLRSRITTSLEQHRELDGVLVTATLLKLVQESAGPYFVPQFRSFMYPLVSIYSGPTKLSEAVRVGLHAAFHGRAG